MQKQNEIIVFDKSKHPAMESHEKGGKAIAVKNPTKEGQVLAAKSTPPKGFLSQIPEGYEPENMKFDYEEERAIGFEASAEAQAGVSLATMFTGMIKFFAKVTGQEKKKFKVTGDLKRKADKLQLPIQSTDIIEIPTRTEEDQS